MRALILLWTTCLCWVALAPAVLAPTHCHERHMASLRSPPPAAVLPGKFIEALGHASGTEILAGLAGTLVAAAIMLPAMVCGPLPSLPMGAAVLGFLSLRLSGGGASLAVNLGAGFLGAMLGLLLLLCLLPTCGVLQFLLPALVGALAGLCTAFHFGGTLGVELCSAPVVVLALLHLLCLMRIMKMGGWS